MEYYYQVQAIPDPNQASVAARFGDYKQIIFDGWKSLCRLISEFKPGELNLSLCYLFDPGLDNGIQNRLKLWLKVSCSKKFDIDDIDSLVLHGPVSDFYNFEKQQKEPFSENDWNRFEVCGEIVRLTGKVKSYISKTENPNVLSNYLTLKKFQPKEDNDYMSLDRQLSNQPHKVYIEINIRPVNVQAEINYIYKYISTLVKINDLDFGEAETLIEDYRQHKGLVRDHLAEEILREHEEMANNLRRQQLEFYIRIYSQRQENVQMIASCLAESAFLEGDYSILTIEKSDSEFNNILKQRNNPWHKWQKFENFPEPFIRFPRIASIEELAGAFRLPVGRMVSPRTIRKTTDPKIAATITGMILIGDDMESGIAAERDYSDLELLFDQPSASTIEHRIALEKLKKHMFIAGVPGSGKTTAMFNILVQLSRADIPFLIIEPAKTEYRILKALKHHKNKELKKLGEMIRIYSPGNEDLSPLRFNPMSYPEGISLDEHMNNLMSCFQAAMPMEGPLPALLAEAVEKVYEDHEDPYFADLMDAMTKIMKEKNYDSEIKGNLETAIAVRLSPMVRRSMGKVFQKTETPNELATLLENPVIIEMDALSQDQANLMTLFILTSLREYIKCNRQSGSELKHIVVLEEAHNIVGRVPAGGESNDPREKAAQYVSRMLAELRALGEGILIADQLPSTVAATVIKNTGTKLAHRLTSMDDREELGYTMLAGGLEIEEFARLQVGEAFYYTEGLYRCRRVRCINSNAFMNLSQPPKNEDLYSEILYEEWFKEAAIMHTKKELKEFLNIVKKEYEARITIIEDSLEEMKGDDIDENLLNQIIYEFMNFKKEFQEEWNIINTQKSLEDKINNLQIWDRVETEMNNLNVNLSSMYEKLPELETKLEKIFKRSKE